MKRNKTILSNSKSAYKRKRYWHRRQNVGHPGLYEDVNNHKFKESVVAKDIANGDIVVRGTVSTDTIKIRVGGYMDDGSLFIEETDFHIGSHNALPITPKALEHRLKSFNDKYKDYLEYKEITRFEEGNTTVLDEPTFDLLVSHIGILSPTYLKHLLYGEDLTNACYADIITRQEIFKTVSILEKSILKDGLQARSVFRYKSTMNKMEHIEDRKLAIEERTATVNTRLIEERIKVLQKTAELEEKTGNFVINFGKGENEF